MDKRHVIFALGLLALAVLAGYVRDLGKAAGVSAATVSTLERFAIFA